MRGEDANLLSVGAIDFGIIVDAAVILVENIYRNFQAPPEATASAACATCRGKVGRRSDASDSARPDWTERLRLILISALQIDRAVFFSTAIIVAAFIPLFTMQGVEGQIFSPMARTYAYALVGALDRDLHGDACLASLSASGARRAKSRPSWCAAAMRSITPVLRWSLSNRKITVAIGLVFLVVTGFVAIAPRQRIPADTRRRQSVDPRHDAADDFAGGRHADRRQDPREFFCAIRKSSPLFRSTAVPTTEATRRGSSMPNFSCR